MYFIQHCFICRPSESTVPENAGIETRGQILSIIQSPDCSDVGSRQSDAFNHWRDLINTIGLPYLTEVPATEYI